jgi:DNA topoisomerase I
MGNKLVIVESPAKARTIGKILGSDYNLMASMGHVRDLPERSLGVDVKNNFNPEYTVTKSGTIKTLNAAAKNADEIYLATDPDREGEAIAWHLKEILSKKTKGDFSRVEFHEITKTAINKAFDAPREIDLNLVDSQQARRILDRLVGYQVSPLLWSRIERGISAGRVQSVALRMVCERERVIQDFVPKEYWNFTAHLLWKNKKENLYVGKLFKIDDKKAEVPNQKTADAIFSEINSAKTFNIDLVKIEPVKRYAPPPFITSTLQQAGGAFLRFPANKTMRVAQQLYEGTDTEESETGGLITYMRTDSFTISNEARQNCRDFILENYGQKYIPAKFNMFKNKSTAQEAHEAIRPTDVNLKPEDAAQFLDKDQSNLYNLIWKRFVASQMSPAEYTRTSVDSVIIPENTKYTFRTTASVMDFSGFTKVTDDKTIEAQAEKRDLAPDFLKTMKKGDESVLDQLEREQKFTEPPPRFTEPSLIKELEANGIGRPSTYASIVNTIQKRKYVNKEKGKLIPEELGFRVNDYLIASLPELFNIGFTAEMERKLDNIETGQEHWTVMLQNFYNSLSLWVDSAKYKSAPEKEKVIQLLTLMNKISNWVEAVKRGKRTYDDRKFCNSLQKQFEKNGKLSEKQWLSALRLAIKYSDQLTSLNEIAEKNMFLNEINEVKGQILIEEKEKERRLQENKQGAQILTQILKYFDNVNIPAPSNGTSFSEKEFIESLKKRANENKALTPKQENVLRRIAVAYKNEINKFDELAVSLSISISGEEIKQNAEKRGGNSSTHQNSEITGLLASFEAFEDWKEPVNKGRKVFDDKAFYLSLKDQFKRKLSLSNKQVAALKKLVSKYFENEKEKK